MNNYQNHLDALIFYLNSFNRPKTKHLFIKFYCGPNHEH